MRCPFCFLLCSLTSASVDAILPSSKPAKEHSLRKLAIVSGSNETVHLRGNSSESIIYLDYKHNVEGFLTSEVVSAVGDTSRLEISYSETKAELEASPTSDGPLGLAAAMDGYHVNIYNITGPSTHTNRLIQGAFRYQKLKLSSTGELALRNIGVKPTNSSVALDSLPGFFESSNDDINQIWNTGARTIQSNEILAKFIPDFWQISSQGFLVESQVSQVLGLVAAASLTQYNLSFEVSVIANRFTFSVLADTLKAGIYIFCDITNRTISVKFGTCEDSTKLLASGPLPSGISVGNWIKVNAAVNLIEISVTFDGVTVLHFTQASSVFGSFGLGAALGHFALFRNLSATTDRNDVLVYSHSLTDTRFSKTF